MLDKKRHLLLSNKALESLPWLAGHGFLDDGLGVVPPDTSSKREQVLHESGLARKENFDRTLAKAGGAALLNVVAMTLNGAHCVLGGDELHVTILSLGGNTLHDDVNGLLVVVQNLGVAAQESDDLGTASTKRNLKRCWLMGNFQVAKYTDQYGEKTYVLELHHTIADRGGLSSGFNERKVVLVQSDLLARHIERAFREPVELSRTGSTNIRIHPVVDHLLLRNDRHLVVLGDRLEDQRLRDASTTVGRAEEVGIPGRRGRERVSIGAQGGSVLMPDDRAGGALRSQAEGRRRQEDRINVRSEVARLGSVVEVVLVGHGLRLRGGHGSLRSMLGRMKRGIVTNVLEVGTGAKSLLPHDLVPDVGLRSTKDVLGSGVHGRRVPWVLGDCGVGRVRIVVTGASTVSRARVVLFGHALGSVQLAELRVLVRLRV